MDSKASHPGHDLLGLYVLKQKENQTIASITYQNYFKLYEKISGCTGTAETESAEFFEIYGF